MINYETFQKIRYLSENCRLSPSQIAKDVNLCTKTVKKYLKMEKFEKPVFGKKSSKLDNYRDIIRHYTESQYDYSGRQILDIIRKEGYKGGRSIFYEFLAEIRPPRKTAYLTLNFSPGEAAQVDFASCGKITVGQTRRRLYAFAMVLCYSRMIYVEFIMKQNMEHFLQCHRNAFEYFGGIPEYIMVDNCKTAVSKISRFSAAEINPHYADLAAHYGFRVSPCGVRKPHEKGRVERGISYLRQSFLRGRKTGTFGSMNYDLRHWMENTANTRIHGTTGEKPEVLFKVEKKEMNPLGSYPYDCAVVRSVRVSKQFHVTFETNKYSVPPKLAGQNIEMKIYPDKLLFCSGNQIEAEHERCYEKNKILTQPEHEKHLLAKRKKARRGRAVRHFLEMGSDAEKYYKKLQKKRFNADKHVKKIMTLVEVYGRKKVKTALKDALEFEAYSSEYINNILELRSKGNSDRSPLHITRNSDCLDITIDDPNLDIYNI